MKINKKVGIIAATAMASALAVTVVSSTPSAAPGKEKCYGVAKKGKNDCASATMACAGASKVDGDKDAYVNVPTGLCAKLVNGSLEPKTKKK